MGNRNSVLYLLEIYELLLKQRQTFNALRKQMNVEYYSLRGLLDKLIEQEYVFEQIIDNVTYYQATEKLIQLFQGKFYTGIKKLKDL